MCETHDESPALSRRTLLVGSGAAVAATALGPMVPAYAHERRHVLSDVHISDLYPVAMSDMRDSLADLDDAAPKADALVIIGDLTELGKQHHYPLLDLTLKTSVRPPRTYLAIGNHEYHANEPVDVMRQRFLDYAGRDSVYYATSLAGIPFVFLGSEGIPTGETSGGAVTALLSDAQLDWFEQTLKTVARKDRPTFVFLHQPPEITTQRDRLARILASAPNVVFFYGHLHTDLNWFAAGPDPSLLGNDEGYWRVQAPATTYINQKTRNANGTVSTLFQADWKQGLVVDVYDDSVVIRGRDTYQRQWIETFQVAIPVAKR
ncbi:Tat (twin-arginine translocation) pathway signal sequence [Asanoa ishikariensis]|uniref:Tat (Twin-arginine translocation) pathway signal sequence n=1 Tax=Asanoa ishikariensis TaxID=137265 RepID=A0A1H3NQN8_9ACTN|nr:metallophosphoesterase [Asanoa ishikariensis]SDY91083.1 Tat (twin-arginine translocation) pathway signal sequence [Asanoa ishikariensis]